MKHKREKLMKTTSKLAGITASLMALGVSLVAQAAIYSFSASEGGVYAASASSLGQVIPDNNPSGVAYALSFGATGLQISDISVRFNISGGWNGDLYAYLSHGSSYAVLLSRVGATASGDDGYSTAGIDIVLQPLTTHFGLADIHNVESPTTGGSYQADGRVLYTDSSRPQTLDNFLNADPNGDWTLFFADRAAVSVSQLTSWTVSITAVPEPVNVALAIFALLFAAAIAVARLRKIRNPKSEIRKQDC
jgi:subtilisin-like proprotein convertase family protein